MSIKKHTAEIGNMIEREGAQVVGVTVTGGGHLKYRIDTGAQQRNVIVSATPSDHRASAETRSLVRRIVREVR